ncbi:hypothetical protein CALCODRAFT_291960 [Calocera cornea HHB12733]|uniref:Uncharacterized protein n=1 Tax=Calocera cornea HHB12733 TaxID=1353952 RepID=A0A165FQ63_9BASI|nr:hypothetical protein CALCODRAFT_291960 [Calocera cornea HHB12733]
MARPNEGDGARKRRNAVSIVPIDSVARRRFPFYLPFKVGRLPHHTQVLSPVFFATSDGCSKSQPRSNVQHRVTSIEYPAPSGAHSAASRANPRTPHTDILTWLPFGGEEPTARSPSDCTDTSSSDALSHCAVHLHSTQLKSIEINNIYVYSLEADLSSVEFLGLSPLVDWWGNGGATAFSVLQVLRRVPSLSRLHVTGSDYAEAFEEPDDLVNTQYPAPVLSHLQILKLDSPANVLWWLPSLTMPELQELDSNLYQDEAETMQALLLSMSPFPTLSRVILRSWHPELLLLLLGLAPNLRTVVTSEQSWSKETLINARWREEAGLAPITLSISELELVNPRWWSTSDTRDADTPRLLSEALRIAPKLRVIRFRSGFDVGNAVGDIWISHAVP